MEKKYIKREKILVASEARSTDNYSRLQLNLIKKQS